MLRGNAPARIDDKGRLKVPDRLPRRSFRTSTAGTSSSPASTGDSVRIYPMPVWLEIERKLAQMPSTHPARLKFLDRVNYFGQAASSTRQGRVLIHAAPARQRHR